jgi:hypothetical protein
MENLATMSEGQISRRLPPPDAWKRPDKWLDLSTGLVRRDAPRLVLPSDDRGMLRPDEVVEVINEMYFWGDYDWPYEPSDAETKPDAHHFYHYKRWYSADENGGSDTAADIRYVGYRANIILNIETDKKYVNALTDLIGIYINFDHPHSVAADAMLREHKDEQGLPSGIMTYVPGTPIVTYQGKISELRAMRNYIMRGDTPKWMSGHTLYGVVYTQDAAFYLKLDDFESFKPL